MNIERLIKPQVVKANNIIVVATIGIGINAFTAWLFNKGKKNDLNIRSAYLHFVADALVSTGVVVSGVIIVLTGIQWIDTLVSFSIIAVILCSSYHLLIDSVNLALDAVPENINIKEVREFLQKLPEVCDIHDLHIWALSTSDAALTVHLSTIEQTGPGFITSIQRQLSEQFNIGHATIQVEFGSNEDCGMNY